ncbi:MAG: DUF2258 domain-containing protein [Desulfurococcales archaeon]|nr:DUF2258 domain-containing protein [Desulfurococcales archaeon]
MPVVRTGPVRVSGYAIKIRRVVNAALRDLIKEKKVDTKKINQQISDLNAKIYQVLVDRFEIPKEAIANIVVDFDIEDSDLKINDITIEIYDRDDILSRNATNEVKKILGLMK